MFFLPNNLFVGYLWRRALENMAKVHAIHIDPCASRSSLELYSFNLSESCAQIQVYFRLSLSVTHANYLSGLLGYMLRSNTWTLVLHQAGKIIIINHLVNKVKIHARGNKFVSSAIFDQLWTSSIKPLGAVPFFTADSGLLSLDYNSTGKFSTPSCCLWSKQWIFSAVFPRLLNHIQIKSITYHLLHTTQKLLSFRHSFFSTSCCLWFNSEHLSTFF